MKQFKIGDSRDPVGVWSYQLWSKWYPTPVGTIGLIYINSIDLIIRATT